MASSDGDNHIHTDDDAAQQTTDDDSIDIGLQSEYVGGDFIFTKDPRKKKSTDIIGIEFDTVADAKHFYKKYSQHFGVWY